MPTYDTLTDDPLNYPTAVRTPDGSAPRNATTIAGPLQDLANRTAFLKRFGPDHSGTVVDMKALPAPRGGDDFWSLEFGHYVFRTAVTAGPEPFCYAANDGTVGRWVSPMIRLFCGQAVPNGDPAVIQSSLIPTPSYPRKISQYVRTCNAFTPGTQHITTSTYVQINDGTNDLSDEVACQAGDKVRVVIGPIYGNTSNDADTLTVNAHVIDGVSSADYPMPLVLPAPTGANVAQCRYLEFEHEVVNAGPITIYLQAKCNVGGAGYVHFESFGPSGSQWMRVEVTR